MSERRDKVMINDLETRLDNATKQISYLEKQKQNESRRHDKERAELSHKLGEIQEKFDTSSQYYNSKMEVRDCFS